AVGTAREALDRTVAHIGGSERPGRPAGSLPAAGHRLADLCVQVEAARSLTYAAAREPGPGHDGGPLALAHALEALRAAADECVRLPGGLGATGEHEAQPFFRRAASDELLFGPVRRLRARAAERTGLLGEAAA
ncbi:acyl-CoA dehydrogenase, partial [Streptomyces sp. SID6041]|nr:acyl-CoA dehydrogenase [Streptomyces sp. SID6041]